MSAGMQFHMTDVYLSSMLGCMQANPTIYVVCFLIATCLGLHAFPTCLVQEAGALCAFADVSDGFPFHRFSTK